LPESGGGFEALRRSGARARRCNGAMKTILSFLLLAALPVDSSRN